MASICSEPASKWTPIWLREGSQCPHSRSRRRVSRWTHPSCLAPPGDARQSGVDASRHALHGDGRAPGVPFRPRQPDAGEGVALRVFGRKAGCGSYPKGRRSIVPNVHGPRLALIPRTSCPRIPIPHNRDAANFRVLRLRSKSPPQKRPPLRLGPKKIQKNTPPLFSRIK